MKALKWKRLEKTKEHRRRGRNFAAEVCVSLLPRFTFTWLSWTMPACERISAERIVLGYTKRSSVDRMAVQSLHGISFVHGLCGNSM
jgi:hypothetical protein